MVAAYFTVDAPYTTGRRKNVQTVGPNLLRYTGTWVANGTDTSITIDLTDTTVTNLSIAAVKISAYGVHVDAGTIASEVSTKPNVTKTGASGPGKIGILACQTDHTGTFWADVVV